MILCWSTFAKTRSSLDDDLQERYVVQFTAHRIDSIAEISSSDQRIRFRNDDMGRELGARYANRPSNGCLSSKSIFSRVPIVCRSFIVLYTHPYCPSVSTCAQMEGTTRKWTPRWVVVTLPSYLHTLANILGREQFLPSPDTSF